MNELLIDEIKHGLVALPFAYLMWVKTKSWRLAIIPIITVYAIDADHLIDYWGNLGQISFNLADFLGINYFKASGRAFVLLHAWEWVAILGVISYKRGWKSYFTALTFGFLAHILWDSYTINSVIFYSIIYRGINGFILPL